MKNKFHKLRRELEILKNLDHPNIVKFYGIYMDDYKIHYVMEYLQGVDLFSQVIENGHFKEAEAVKIIQKIFSATNHMHQRGVIHRDLKPENIMFLNEENDIKIIDFGLSRMFCPDEAT